MIAATLTLEEAARRPWPVVVVGAGPSGALAAREATRRGVEVLLIEKAILPRWKVCGCCINRRALAALAEVGLCRLVEHCGAVRLGEICLAAGRKQAAVSLPGGVALSRERFDAALVEAAVREGVAFLPGVWAGFCEVGSPDSASGHTLFLRQGARQVVVATSVVLLACGLGGASARQVAAGSRIGAGVVASAAPPFYNGGRIYMACGAGGYLGLVRLEDGRLNLAAAWDRRWIQQAGGLGRAAADLLDGVGWPVVPRLAELAWRGTPALTREAVRPAGHRLFLLGDAAGYVEPFTGEGIAWALACGAAVAPLAARAARDWHPVLADEWTWLYRQLIARRQLACRAVAWGLRRPTLTRTVVRLLAWLPGLAAPFVRRLNEPAWRGEAILP